jgi:hypothetical protein
MTTGRFLRGCFAVSALGGALALSACADGLGPDDVISAADAAAVAALLADTDPWAGVALGSDPGTHSRSFSRTETCPAGGSITVSGSGESTRNAETRVVSRTWSTTHAHSGCTSTRTRGDQQVTVVIDGRVTASGASSWQLPEERGGERVLLSYSGSRSGSTTTTVGDRTRTCEVNLTETFDPATRTFRVTGVVCGREVDFTRGQGGQRHRG